MKYLTLDGLKRLKTVIDNRISSKISGIDVGVKAAYDLANGKANASHTHTPSQVGLGNVPNVATNNQTPTYNTASTRTALVSGESLSTAMGKIKKYFTDLKNVAFTGSYNDLSNKPTTKYTASTETLDINI